MTVAVRTFVDESPATREALAELEDADADAIDRAVAVRERRSRSGRPSPGRTAVGS